MPRARLQRLSRRQIQTLRNPLPTDELQTGLAPDKKAFEAAEKEALKFVKPLIRKINAKLPNPKPPRAVSDFAQAVAPYLAAQRFRVFSQMRGVKGDAGELTSVYLGLDSTTWFAGVLAAQADPLTQAVLAEALSAMGLKIEEYRALRKPVPKLILEEEVDDEGYIPAEVLAEMAEGFGEGDWDEAEEEEVSVPAQESAQDGDDIAAFLRQPWQTLRLALDEWMETLSLPELRRAQVLEGERKSRENKKPRGKVLAALHRELLSRAPSDKSRPAPAPAASPREKAAVGREEAGQTAFERILSAGDGATAGGAGGDDGGDDSGDDYDIPPSEDEDPRPSRGPAGKNADPSAIRADRNVRTRRIRGSAQRAEARTKRIEGYEKALLPYRRPQAKSRSPNVDVPILYAPPQDVLDKVKEIQEKDDRKGLPRQFQDVLVYVLTEDYNVGRGKIIPAGSVEVYNKGTLVGTIGRSLSEGGRSGLTENIRKAMFYAGTLVGLDLRARKFEASKGSRTNSRIYYALQNKEGFSLVAPSLNEVLKETPLKIELNIDRETSMRDALGGARNNPRRGPRVHSIGAHRFKPTARGYLVLTGPLRGSHYTTRDFGHGCKLAMLLDLTSGKI